MAFDFNGSSRAAKPSGGSSRKDIDHTAMNANSGPSHRPANGFGGQASGEPGRQTDGRFRSTGFSNKPVQREPVRSVPPGGSGNMPARTTPRPPVKPPARRRRGMGGYADIPWRIILPIIGIAILVILCVVFRDAITEFLAQVLAWVIVVIIIVCLLKWLVFGGRRRR